MRLLCWPPSGRTLRLGLVAALALAAAAATAMVLPPAASAPVALTLSPANPAVPNMVARWPRQAVEHGADVDLGSGRRAAVVDLSPNALPSGAEASGMVHHDQEGFWLPAQHSGWVRLPLSFPAFGADRAIAYATAYGGSEVITTVAVLRPDGTRREVPLGEKIDVTEEARTGVVLLEVAAANYRDERFLFLDRVVQAVEPPVQWPAPALVAVWAALLLALVAALLHVVGVRPAVNAALVAVLGAAAALRIDALFERADQALWPDAMVYRLLAEELRHPYDTGGREPLWPLLARGWFELAGSSDLLIRVLSTVVSVLLVLAVYRFAAAYTGDSVVGLAAAAVVALHPLLIELSAEGMREPLYALAAVLVAHYALVIPTPFHRRSRLVVLTAVVAASALVRIWALTFVPLLLVLAVLTRRLSVREAAVPLLVALALLLPSFEYQRRNFGDPLWVANAHATWHRNFEAVRGTLECPDCPEQQTFEQNAYAGERVSAASYVFGSHSPETVVTNTARGFWRIFLDPSSSLLQRLLGHPWLVPLYLLGAAALLVSPRRELLLVPLVLVNLLAFMVPIGLELRQLTHVVPFVVLIAVLPIAAALRLLTVERGRGREFLGFVAAAGGSPHREAGGAAAPASRRVSARASCVARVRRGAVGSPR